MLDEEERFFRHQSQADDDDDDDDLIYTFILLVVHCPSYTSGCLWVNPVRVRVIGPVVLTTRSLMNTSP